MKVDRAGLPFLAAAIMPALGLVLARQVGWAVPFAGLAGFMAYFFRDPDRHAPSHPEVVVAPADGRVMIAGAAEADTAPPGVWLQVTIFLSPFDVHVNRAPVGGKVTRIEYRRGRFLPAYRKESRWNERNEIWIDHGGQPIVVRQVVGILARRIVCRVDEGRLLQPGDRIGLMKFGSRMDVFLPPTADVRVRVGERVRAGETVLAALEAPPTVRAAAVDRGP